MDTDSKNSDKNLSKIIGKSTGFKVSDDYFKSLEDTIMANVSSVQFEKNTGFIVPENYFSTLEEEIIIKTRSKPLKNKVILLRTTLARFTSVAAAACILLFVGLQFFSPSTQQTFDSLAANDIENWITTMAINEEELITALEATDFENNELIITEITDASIENFLDTDDITVILNEIE